MKSNKKIFISVLLAALVLGVSPSYAYMTPEASVLYQQACSDEHQQDLKSAISKLERAIELTGGDTMLYTKLAGIYSEIDQYDKALELYKKVIAINPEDSFIYISVGSIYENQGKYKDALAAYNKALDIFPEYKYNYYNIASVQYQLKNYNEAIKNYNTFLETYPGHLESRENLAQSYFVIKDYQNAAKQYKYVYNKNSDKFKHYGEYGIALLNTEEPKLAIDMLEKAIEEDADNNSAHLGLAQAYQDMKKNDLAYEQYQIVLKKVPNLNTVRLDYANLLADMDKNTEAIEQYKMYIKAYPDDIKGYINIATVYKDLGNYDNAIDNYLIAISKDDKNIDIKKDIANCYHNKKNYETALKYYDEILALEPNDYNVKFNKALALHAIKKYDEAITLYRELLEQKNEKTVKNNLNNAMVSRGHELVAAQEYNDAISMFKSAIKDGYSDGYVYYGIAKAYRGLGDNSKAAENYEKAISIDPEKTVYSAEYSDFISEMYSRVDIGDSDDEDELPSINITMDNKPVETVSEPEKPKETKVKEVVKTSPVISEKNEDLILEGDKNYKDNKYDSAIKNYQDALQLVPNDAVTLLKLGNIYKIKGDNDKAINYYLKSIVVNPDYTDGWFNLGLAYANANNLIESQKSFEKVIALDSDYNFGYAYYALGMALEHQGKTSDAVKNYKLFVKYNNDKDLIKAVQDKIKQIQ